MTPGWAVQVVDIEVDRDVTIHAEVSGAGVPVVVLHGFTGDVSTMRGVSERLAADHLVIAPDLVGHGRSSAPERLTAYGVGAMAGHVALLVERLGHDQFHLVGYSMGGRVALTLACESPERVRSLGLIGASAGIADDRRRSERRRDDEALADRIEDDGLEKFVEEWLANPLFATQSSLGPAHLLQARRQRLTNDPSALARSLRGGGTAAMVPLQRRLAGCDTPTLVIAGDDDGKFRSIATDLVESMPDAHRVIVEHAGHAAHLEQPDTVASAIAAHIADVEAR